MTLQHDAVITLQPSATGTSVTTVTSVTTLTTVTTVTAATHATSVTTATSATSVKKAITSPLELKAPLAQRDDDDDDDDDDCTPSALREGCLLVADT